MARKILFVDDESDLQFMVTAYFEMNGYQVISAANADEAIREATSENPGAIILDVNLPGDGSFRVLDFLVKNHPAAPVIIYSGHDGENENVKKMLQHGAKRFLVKDGSLDALLNTIKEICP